MRVRKPRVYQYFDPLKNWDGIAYWQDGKTPMDVVKREVQTDMRYFDDLPPEWREILNREGGVAEEVFDAIRPQTTGGF